MEEELEQSEETPSRRETLEQLYDDAVTATETPADVEESVEAPAEAVEEPAVSDEPPVALPRSWAKDAKATEVWASLPRDIQQQLNSRENQRDVHYQRALQELSSKRELFGHIEQAVAPHLRELTLDGVDTGKLFQETLEFRRFLKEDAEGAITWLMQTVGVSPERLATRYNGQPKESPEVAGLRTQLQQMENYFSAQQEAQSKAQRQDLMNHINSFANEKDANGNPLRPYAFDLEDDMAPIIAALVRQNPHAEPRTILQDAYDRAVWANPQFRAHQLKQQAEAQQKEDRARIEKARRAGASVNGAPAGSVTQAPSSRRDALSAAWDAQMSAA